MRIPRDKARGIKCYGKLIAVVETVATAIPYPVGWTGLSLYRTRRRVYICSLIHNINGRLQYSAEKCLSADGVVHFFGMGEAAIELYRQLGLSR